MPKDNIYYMVMDKDHKPITDKKFKNAFDANIYFEDHEESKYIVKVTEQILVEKVGDEMKKILDQVRLSDNFEEWVKNYGKT